jgi:hypothetical protein
MDPEFLSGEASASPAVEPLLAGARSLSARGSGGGALSARNGPRVTTHASMPFDLLTEQDFIEIADYDPHLDRVLCIGKRAPHVHAGMHALVFRAKKEVGAIVQVEAAPKAQLPTAKRGRTQLETAMSVLEALRGDDIIAMGPFVIAVGRTPAEAIARAESVLG